MINGYCVAGGLILALSCDLSVASRKAVFSVPEAKWGFAEPYIAALFFGRISTAKAKLFALTGCQFTADEAERLGMLSEVVADEELSQRVSELIEIISTMAPNAMRRYKEFINENIPRPYMSRAMEAMRDADVAKRTSSFGSSNKAKA
jgi:enoyl-CoA hydratase/carnithine racemase